MRFIFMNRFINIRNPVKIYPIPSLETWGFTNRVISKKGLDGFFFMADFDNVEYTIVEDDIKYLQRYYRDQIGTVMSRTTRLKNYSDKEVGSFHIISFVINDRQTVKRLLEKISCDEHFKRGYRYQSRCWVLRLGEKVDKYSNEIKRPATVFKKIYPARTDSLCYRALIKKFEDIDSRNYMHHFRNLDNSKDVELIRYDTK